MRRYLEFMVIGCGGLLTLVLVLALVGSVIGGGDEPSSPSEHAEKREGVEQADKRRSKQPPQEVEKEESDAGADEDEGADDPEPVAKTARVKITRVVDGDTIEISPSVDGEDTVRLIGIDAPEEASASCGAQPIARDAADQIETWKGSRVKLEFDEDRTDGYGRLLAYVTAHALVDTMLNEDMVLGGLTQVYIVPPNTKYEDRLRKAQQEAKKGPLIDTSIWTLPASKQDQLADRGNGIGIGDGACPPKPQQQRTATAPATGSPSPAPSRDYDVPNPNVSDPNAPGTAPSTASPAAGGRDCEPPAYPVPPGSEGDGDNDGCAGEE